MHIINLKLAVILDTEIIKTTHLGCNASVYRMLEVIINYDEPGVVGDGVGLAVCKKNYMGTMT